MKQDLLFQNSSRPTQREVECRTESDRTDEGLNESGDDNGKRSTLLVFTVLSHVDGQKVDHRRLLKRFFLLCIKT